MAEKICVIEDDKSVNELICVTLKSAGYEVVSFGSAEEYLEAQSSFDLILLDVMLPGISGFELFERLKTPVIFLTARATELDKVTGLNLGAQDYITKPFMVLELIARVKGALRRTSREKASAIEVGIITLDDIARRIYVDGKRAELTYKEFEMLKYFMLNLNKVITRESLLNNVWGIDAQIETRTIDMHIKTLRKKLGVGGQYIKTVRGVGYKFEVE